MSVKRGEIYWVDLDGNKGSEIGNSKKNNPHPGVIVQNNTGNKHAPTTIVVPFTSYNSGDERFPQNVVIKNKDMKNRDSSITNPGKKTTILCGQLRTVSKKHRLENKAAELRASEMNEVEDAIKSSLALDN